MNLRKNGAVAAMTAVLFMGWAAPSLAAVAVAGKAGTLGGGVEMTVGLSRLWNVRLGANAFNYTDENRETSGIFYDAEAKLRTGTALLDFHPGGGGFRLTGGIVFNDTRIEGSSLPPASGFYDIGGVQVPAALVGTLDGTIDFDPVVPYAGIGWGNAVEDGKKVGFFLDLGVIFQGQAEVTLTPNIPSGSPLNAPLAREALQILLDREERDIEADAADYDLYPVVAIGISYRF
jgi:hypothetical protein